MKKKVYIHIGAHKSASTLIQQNMRENRALFREKYDVDYLLVENLVDTPFIRHFRAIANTEKAMSEHRFFESVEKTTEYIDEAISLSPCGKILISWEGILGHSALDRYQGIYTHVKTVSESLKAIFKNQDCRVVLIVRKQDSFIESCYLQQIKEGRTLSFQEFIESIDIHKISWCNIADTLESDFGENFGVVPFESITILGAKLFLGSFFNFLMGEEIDMEEVALIENANSGLSARGVDISREILPYISEKNLRAMKKLIFAEFNSSKLGKASFFDGFTRALIKKANAEGNRELYIRYFSEFISSAGMESDTLKAYWL